MNNSNTGTSFNYQNYLMASGFGKSFKLNDAFHREADESSTQPPVAIENLPVDQVYRSRLESDFSFSMPSAIIRPAAPPKVVNKQVNMSKYLFQLSNFPAKANGYNCTGPWLSTNISPIGKIRYTSHVRVFNLALDLRALQREGKISEAISHLDTDSVTVDWSSVRSASWALGADRIGEPIIVDAVFKTANTISVQFLVAISDGGKVYSEFNGRVNNTKVTLDVIMTLNPIFDEDAPTTYDW